MDKTLKNKFGEGVNIMEKRNFGLDVCRAVAMAMIVMLHVLGQGGLLDAVIPAGRGYWIVWGMETLAFCSVDMFAILSGYLCEGDERFSVYRVMELISIVMFYVIPLFLLFLVLAPETVSSMKVILRALCPPLSRAYWYITCYVPLALLRPYINKSLRSLSLVQHRNLCVICFVLFMCIPNLMHTDIFRFEYGYSFVWLMVCYVFGAYMKRANVSVKKSCALLLFLTNTVMILLCRLVMSVIFPSGVDYMLTYTSPFVFSMAFFFCSCALKYIFAEDGLKKYGKQCHLRRSMCTFFIRTV